MYEPSSVWNVAYLYNKFGERDLIAYYCLLPYTITAVTPDSTTCLSLKLCENKTSTKNLSMTETALSQHTSGASIPPPHLHDMDATRIYLAHSMPSHQPRAQ